MLGRYAAILLLTLPVTCGCQDTKRQQGRALLELIQAIEVKTPYAKRKTALASLQAVELTDSDLARVRELCLKAHRALIESEEQQAIARTYLDGTLSENPKAPIAPDKVGAVTVALEQSNKSLRVAITTFPLCEREVRSLALHFGR